jgi:hypothetical protein
MYDDALREGEGHETQGGEEAKAGHEDGLQRDAGQMGSESSEVCGWGGQKGCDDVVVGGEGGEVKDSQGVEERMGFSVCLAAGKADGVRGGGGRGGGDVAAVGAWRTKAGFSGVVRGSGVEKEEFVYGVPDFAGGEEEGACGCGGGIGSWGGEGSLGGGGFTGA